METLISIGVVATAFAIPLHSLLFSKMARSTNELSRVNYIWEKFNSGAPTEELEHMMAERTWRYHQDKVNILKTFIKLTRKQ